MKGLTKSQRSLFVVIYSEEAGLKYFCADRVSFLQQVFIFIRYNKFEIPRRSLKISVFFIIALLSPFLVKNAWLQFFNVKRSFMSFLGENRSVAYIYQNFYGLYVLLFLEV